MGITTIGPLASGQVRSSPLKKSVGNAGTCVASDVSPNLCRRRAEAVGSPVVRKRNKARHSRATSTRASGSARRRAATSTSRPGAVRTWHATPFPARTKRFARRAGRMRSRAKLPGPAGSGTRSSKPRPRSALCVQPRTTTLRRRHVTSPMTPSVPCNGRGPCRASVAWRSRRQAMTRHDIRGIERRRLSRIPKLVAWRS